MTRKLILLLTLFLCINSFAQNYEGKIGKYPVFMQLDIDDQNGNIWGYYFYKSKLESIKLEGHKKANKIVVFSKNGDENEKIELFRLTINEEKLSGTWENNDKNLPVRLIKTIQPAEDYRRSQFKIKRDSVVKYKKNELVWFTEKYSKQSMFRLGNGFTKEQRAFLNPKLDTIHNRLSETRLECGVDVLEVNVHFISDKYISFLEMYSLYCGGAHLIYGQKSYTYNLENLEEIKEITAIFPNLEYYTKIKNKYKNDTDLQHECEYFDEYSEEYSWKYCSWYLTKEGITFIPEYPHAMTVCEQEFELTYEEIKQ